MQGTKLLLSWDERPFRGRLSLVLFRLMLGILRIFESKDVAVRLAASQLQFALRTYWRDRTYYVAPGIAICSLRDTLYGLLSSVDKSGRFN